MDVSEFIVDRDECSNHRAIAGTDLLYMTPCKHGATAVAHLLKYRPGFVGGEYREHLIARLTLNEHVLPSTETFFLKSLLTNLSVFKLFILIK